MQTDQEQERKASQLRESELAEMLKKLQFELKLKTDSNTSLEESLKTLYKSVLEKDETLRRFNAETLQQIQGMMT